MDTTSLFRFDYLRELAPHYPSELAHHYPNELAHHYTCELALTIIMLSECKSPWHSTIGERL
jgi:hypothetical protein